MPIVWIEPLPDIQFNDADDGAQVHRLSSPVPRFASAAGEKLRRGGLLQPEVFVSAAGASIRDLRLELPFRFHAASALLGYPSSCSFPGLMVFFSDEEPDHGPIMVVVSRCAPQVPI